MLGKDKVGTYRGEEMFFFRVGATMDLIKRKAEHEDRFCSVKNWTEVGVFTKSEDAQEWLSSMAGSLKCESDDEDCIQNNHEGRLYGYYFEHSGEKSYSHSDD